RPAATRWRAADASGRSGLAPWANGWLEAAAGGNPAGAGALDRGSDESRLSRPALEGSAEASGRAGSRPLRPGGALCEVTGYVPIFTPTIAAITTSNSGPDPRAPPRREQVIFAGLRSNSRAGIGPNPLTLNGNMAKGRNRMTRVRCAAPTSPQSIRRRKMSDALVPPKPKEFDRTTSMVRLFERCGTRSIAVSTDGLSRLMVGGATPSRMARIEKIASTAPAAPNRCPIEDLVEDMHMRAAALPTRRCTAPSSISSPTGVEVP